MSGVAATSSAPRLSIPSTKAVGAFTPAGRPDDTATASAPAGGSADTDWPQWSPDGAQIAYASQAPDVNTTDIFIVAASGGTPRRLTDNPGDDTAPSWSRDGRWIYFPSDRDGTFRVWKMPAAGGQAEQLSTREAALSPPLDSLDGAWVYFRSDAIMRVPAAGGDAQAVVREERLVAGAYLPTANGLYYLAAADDFRSATLFVVPFAGGDPRVLGTIPSPIRGVLSLSPDSKHLLYSRCDRCEADIMLVENFR